MQYSANFEMTESYFAESFEQWLRCVSRLRKWEAQLGVLVLLLGLVGYFYFRSPLFVAITVFGVIQIGDFFLYRRKWIRQRVASRSKHLDSPVELKVCEAGLYQKGPTSEGTVSWDGVKAALPTPKGLFIATGDKMSIYIPDHSMTDPRFKEYVVKMVNGE